MSTVLKQNTDASATANVLMCKQWWKVCWMYGDQEKYYRQLYAKKATSTPIASLAADPKNAHVLDQDVTTAHRNISATTAAWLSVTQHARYENE